MLRQVVRETHRLSTEYLPQGMPILHGRAETRRQYPYVRNQISTLISEEIGGAGCLLAVADPF